MESLTQKAGAPVTQRQIAEIVGIDSSMVSHALRGDKRVAEATRLRVVAAAEELGYHNGSNIAARSLIARRYGKRVDTNIIAAMTLFPMYGDESVTNLPYFTPFLKGIGDETARRGLDLFLCSLHQHALPRLIQEQSVDGVIALATSVKELHKLDIPIVTIGGAHKETFGLFPDYAAGTRAATEHLIGLGHRRIAYLGMKSKTWATAREQRKGYLKALKNAGIEAAPELIWPHVLHPMMESGAEAMAAMWSKEKDFTAIVCFNDLIAMGAMGVLQSAGMRVPEDISVVGFDNVSEQYGHEPKLTSIAFDRVTMGRRAVEIICDARDKTGHDTANCTDEVFETTLVIRNSTAPVKMTDVKNATQRRKR